MDALLQTNQAVVDELESRTLQLSLAPETLPPVFSLPPALAHALMLQPSKDYTIGVILGAFHTYILNHSLAGVSTGTSVSPVLALDPTLKSILAVSQQTIPYSAAVALLCRQLQPK
jgi:hypothetical protein